MAGNNKLFAVLCGVTAVVLAAVAVADLASKGARATALAWMPARQYPIMQQRPMVVNMPNMRAPMMRQRRVAWPMMNNMMRQRHHHHHQQQRPMIVDLPMRKQAFGGPRMINIPRGAFMSDAALDDFYQQNEIEKYVWTGQHAAGYDPEAQNAWGDLPMEAAAIKEAEGMGIAGTAEKSMSKSCDKTGSCQPPVNAWDYLPETEEKTLANHVEGPEPYNAWGDMTLAY